MLVHVALDRLCETILDQTLDFPGRRHEAPERRCPSAQSVVR